MMCACVSFSLRNVQDPLPERGIDICHETAISMIAAL